MSASNSGVKVQVTDLATGEVTTFNTKSEACFSLNVSMRTLSRCNRDHPILLRMAERSL